MDWYQIKVFISEVGGISRDAIHILAGVAIQFAVAAVLRISIRHIVPYLVVVAAALGNEWFDLHYDVWPERAEQWAESVKDVLVTLALPTLLLLLVRRVPDLLVRPGDSPESGREEQ